MELAGPCKRGMGPETAEEGPLQPIQKQVPKSLLLAVDGAQAWKPAADGCLILTGVNHEKKIFTPASKVAKKDPKQSQGSQESSVTMLLKVSSVTSRNMLRKTNSKGRNAKAKMRSHKVLLDSSEISIRLAGS